MDNPFALVVLACQKSLSEGKIPDQALAEDRLTIAKALLRGNYDRDRIINFLLFLKNILYVDDKKINSIFDETIKKVTERNIDMGVLEIVKQQERQLGFKSGKREGRQEGRLEGRQEGKAEVVKNLILKLGFSDEQAAGIAEVPVAFVSEVRASLKGTK